MQRTLTFVSDIPLRPSGGGTYAVSWHVFEQLRKQFHVIDASPVIPRVHWADALVSKVRRKVLRVPGRFQYFSPRTLASNADQVRCRVSRESDAVFFRSATRWCLCRPSVPYFIHLDIVFHTFFQNTFDPDDFIADDLSRIYAAERDFLENASAVFCESNWGLAEARRAYDLRQTHYQVVGVGGVLAPPDADCRHEDDLSLVSVAMNFRQKGGDLTLEAFKRLKPKYPKLRWHIIGGPPTSDCESVEGIHYEGFLSPQVPQQLQRFRSLLSQAFVLVHPTREDANPLVLIEAAYFGCPSISVRRFAIPDLVQDGITGLLIDPPVSPAQLADAIASLIDFPQRYQAMRQAARRRAVENFDWNRIGTRMNSTIQDHLH
jgi:glycosyltransferase involved in cell wall biosynthesis